jgi:hypothetical protein
MPLLLTSSSMFSKLQEPLAVVPRCENFYISCLRMNCPRRRYAPARAGNAAAFYCFSFFAPRLGPFRKPLG